MRQPLTKIIQSFLLTSVFAAILVHAGKTPEVPLALNLQQDATTANQKRLPMLLMFSATYCEFCLTVEEEFLKPMLISGDYTDKVLVRKVMLDDHPEALNFSGQPLDVSQLADKYNVFVTPTLVFINDKGEEVGERLVGINTVDYYGAYLDQSIGTALNHMRSQAH